MPLNTYDTPDFGAAAAGRGRASARTGGELEEPDHLVSELMARVRQIQIRTHRLVNTALSGGYRSTFRGQGVEFHEVRPYQPGDEVRSIDWNVTARTGEPYIKNYAEERELTLHLLVDTSPSMDFGSGYLTKREAAAQLAALLSYVAIQAQDRVGLTLFGEHPGLHLPARKGAKHILRVVREVLAATPSAGGSNLGGVIEEQLHTLHRRSLIFVLSDFMDGEEQGNGEAPWQDPLMRLALRHDVIALRLVDPLEEELPKAGLLTLREIETGHLREVDASSRLVRDFWRARAAARTARIAEALTKARVEMVDVRLPAERARVGELADTLVSFFRRRSARHGGRSV